MRGSIVRAFEHGLPHGVVAPGLDVRQKLLRTGLGVVLVCHTANVDLDAPPTRPG